MFHRAGTQRIKHAVDPEILLAEPRVMPHDLRFGQSRQTDLSFAAQTAITRVMGGRGGKIHAANFRISLLENQGFFVGEPALLVHGQT